MPQNPSEIAVSYIVGFVKGKSAVRVHRELLHERRMTGLHFWAPGYWVSTVGAMKPQFDGTFARKKTGTRDRDNCLINVNHQ